jgi:hypothetical protein
VMGRPTVARPNFYGEVHSFELPCTKFQARVSTARFVRASADEHDNTPVEPHIVIPEALAPSIHDAELSTAVASLRELVRQRASLATR